MGSKERLERKNNTGNKSIDSYCQLGSHADHEKCRSVDQKCFYFRAEEQKDPSIEPNEASKSGNKRR